MFSPHPFDVTLLLIQLHLFVFVAFVASADFCGEDSLPYRLIISFDGSVQLDCAKPSCFKGAGEYTVLRDQQLQSKGGICESVPWSTFCSSRQGWFAGGTIFSKMKKCCSSNALKYAKLTRQKRMYVGDSFLGGQVISATREVAFDFVSDVRKLKEDDNRVAYFMTISRMVCIPEPPELSNEVESGLETVLFSALAPDVFSQVAHAGIKIDGIVTKSHRHKEKSGLSGTNEAQPINLSQLEPPSKFKPFPESTSTQTKLATQEAARNCFTSPTGHKCCSRAVETMLHDMTVTVSNEMDSNANRSSIQRKMIDFIEAESDKRFCRPFEVIIGNGDFAAKTHLPNDDSLGCKMQVRIGGRSRARRQLFDTSASVFTILAYAMVASAADSNSIAVDFPQAKPPKPAQVLPETGVEGSVPSDALNRPEESFVETQQVNTGPDGAQSTSTPTTTTTTTYINFTYVEPPLPPPPPPPPPPPELIAFLEAAANGQYCFSEDALVATETALKRMDQLIIGDSVLSADEYLPTFSPVLAFLHRLPRKMAPFYRIDTLSGSSIKMTGNHFIYVTDCLHIHRQRIYAADVRIGHCLLLLMDGRSIFAPTPVVNVTKVWQAGIYAPLTATGTIVVNNILASCHSSVAGRHGLHQTFLYWIEFINSWMIWTMNWFDWQIFDNNDIELIFGVRFSFSVLDALLPELSAAP